MEEPLSEETIMRGRDWINKFGKNTEDVQTRLDLTDDYILKRNQKIDKSIEDN